jgi:hypothetical protein
VLGLFGPIFSVIPQNAGPRVTRRLITVNKENFLAGKNRAATKWWWMIHSALPQKSAPPSSDKPLSNVLRLI